MKKIILLLIGCIFFAVSAQAVIYTSDNTYQADEILYDKKTNMPITGIYQEYSQDGNLVREIPYKNGKREGLAKTYYGNGNLWIEGPYKNGKAEGLVKWYYKNGKVWREDPYKNGKFEGVVKEYYENGNLENETPYKNGKREGVDKWYYKNGNLEREINYSQGKAVSGYLYDWEGNRTKMTNAHLHNLNKEINSFQ